nr:alcohol dehydrogenase catalytic domain-containing protein [bacterium]
MRAAYLITPYQFELRDIPIPKPGKGEVLVRVTAAGVCGSDLHFYSAGRIGEVVLDQPFVMGHEFSGVVEDAGEFSAEFPKGARVAAEPSIPCGTCFYCRE